MVERNGSLWHLVALMANIFLTPSGPYEEMKLTINTPMDTIVRTMAAPDSGLEIRDRMWLKITIPNAFIGELALQIVENTENNMQCIFFFYMRY